MLAKIAIGCAFAAVVSTSAFAQMTFDTFRPDGTTSHFTRPVRPEGYPGRPEQNPTAPISGYQQQPQPNYGRSLGTSFGNTYNQTIGTPPGR